MKTFFRRFIVCFFQFIHLNCLIFLSCCFQLLCSYEQFFCLYNIQNFIQNYSEILPYLYVYCLSMKSCPILCIKLLYKMCQELLDIQCFFRKCMTEICTAIRNQVVSFKHNFTFDSVQHVILNYGLTFGLT